MILCDIGNTSYHFLEDGVESKELVDEFHPEFMKKKVYYISVNIKVSKKLQKLDNWVDLQTSTCRDGYYNSMGIDRVFACNYIDNGIVIDAGSAITVDVVRDGKFMGGFISLGVRQIEDSYKTTSPALDMKLNFNIDTSKLPQNTVDAISYASLGLLQKEVLSHNLPIYLTGGDGARLLPLFKGATLDEQLLFKSMRSMI